MNADKGILLLLRLVNAPMKKTLLFFFICRIATAQSSNGDTLNQVDASTGLRQGYWVVLNSVKKLPTYPMEAKVEEGRFADN